MKGDVILAAHDHGGGAAQHLRLGISMPFEMLDTGGSCEF